MPTAEIAPQQALQVTDRVKEDAATPPSLSPVNVNISRKTNFYGIEAFDKLIWTNWDRGKEYIKQLCLKNVSVKGKKFTYRVPETRFFSTIFPKKVFLPPGSSIILPITFRPLEDVFYSDKIIFDLQDEQFEIPLRGNLPQTEISIPIDLDFKMCAVADSMSIDFEVYNIGDLDTDIEWEVKEPFSIEPATATIKVKGSAQFKAAFSPQAAMVYETPIYCKYGKDLKYTKPTLFYGIGKYPYITVTAPTSYPILEETAEERKSSETLENTTYNLNSFESKVQEDKEVVVPACIGETVVEFGRIFAGGCVNLFVELKNISPVRCPFTVEHVPGMVRMETVFNCGITKGSIPPMATKQIPLSFTPQTVDTISTDYFQVLTNGGMNKRMIKCLGLSFGPKVGLSLSCINFGQIDLYHTATKKLELFNNSDMDTIYQFDLDNQESVFKIEPVSGVIKAQSRSTLVARFVPQQAFVHYRRIPFLVHCQPPLFLSLIGTCHSEAQKPVVIKYEHIQRLPTLIERGLSVISPEQLSEMLRRGRLSTDETGCLQITNEIDLTNLELVDYPDVSPIDEYFNDGFHSEFSSKMIHVSSDCKYIDFGCCYNFRVPEERTVNIINHTRGKMTAQWTSEGKGVFSVFPPSQDIPPLKSCSFRVTFKPDSPNNVYGSELECFVAYKCLRDFTQVDNRTVFPPWTITLRCIGHTFLPNHQPFLPQADLLQTVVVFPPINSGECCYHTSVMVNNGEAPFTFDLSSTEDSENPPRLRCGEKEPTKDCYSVKPSKGFIKPGDYQIMTFQLCPSEAGLYAKDQIVRFNNFPKYDKQIHLCGSCESGSILFDTEGILYFKPTCVGNSSKRTYSFKNISRLALRFVWILTPDDKKTLSVEPSEGIVQPNESVSQTWTFLPCSQQKYVLKPSLVVWGACHHENTTGGKKFSFSLRVIGEGDIGELQTENKTLDFGHVVIGSSASRVINIYNSSNCSLHYALSVDNIEDQPFAMSYSRMRNDSSGIDFDKEEGVIPARSKQAVVATIRPLKRVAYNYSVFYTLKAPHCKDQLQSLKESQHLIDLVATGVFPSMIAKDIRAQGSGVGLSKRSLWEYFNIDNLNAYLDSDPSSEELMFNVITRQSIRRRPSIHTNASLDFNFSAAPLGSEPCTINITFVNEGTVPCEWFFMFPRDMQTYMGYWADSGDCDYDELQDMRIMDNKLFTISPKKGSLHPGQSSTLTFTYKHTMIGVDRLPVLLKLAKGRELMLTFVGVTVDPVKPYIHFTSKKHMFNPVPLGEKISPKQVYELYNGGAVPVKYECDLTALEILRDNNFHQPIFECLNPTGTILPGRVMPLEWRFFPLEAKSYEVDIPILVHNGDQVVITFKGIGYDKRIMGDTMPFSDQPELSGVPSKQSADIPGQLGYLSMDRISFGNMPLFSQTRRMVFVTNKSKDRSIFFEWHVTSAAHTKLVNIFPVHAEIKPKKYRMCRITFMASDVPSFYDLDLICEISDLHEYTQYRKQLQAWNGERDRQQIEFCISEDDPHADMRTPTVVDYVGGPPSGRLEKLDALADGRPLSTSNEVYRYKTLPPIRKLTADERRTVELRRQKKQSRLWVRPEAPKPFLLHLGVTARTHDVEHFQANFPYEYCNYFTDQLLKNSKLKKPSSIIHSNQEEFSSLSEDNISGTGVKPHALPAIHCSAMEANIITGVLGNCIRSLLDDGHFIQAAKKVVEEPIPYYLQFTDKNKQLSFVSSSLKNRSTTRLPSVVLKEITFSSPQNDSPRALSIAAEEPDTEKTPMFMEPEKSQEEDSLKPGEDEDRNSLIKSTIALREKQALKRNPELGASIECLLENTILNLMYEAIHSEFSIVSKPKFIALPRKRLTSLSDTKPS